VVEEMESVPTKRIRGSNLLGRLDTHKTRGERGWGEGDTVLGEAFPHKLVNVTSKNTRPVGGEAKQFNQMTRTSGSSTTKERSAKKKHSKRDVERFREGPKTNLEGERGPGERKSSVPEKKKGQSERGRGERKGKDHFCTLSREYRSHSENNVHGKIKKKGKAGGK